MNSFKVLFLGMFLALIGFSNQQVQAAPVNFSSNACNTAKIAKVAITNVLPMHIRAAGALFKFVTNQQEEILIGQGVMESLTKGFTDSLQVSSDASDEEACGLFGQFIDEVLSFADQLDIQGQIEIIKQEQEETERPLEGSFAEDCYNCMRSAIKGAIKPAQNIAKGIWFLIRHTGKAVENTVNAVKSMKSLVTKEFYVKLFKGLQQFAREFPGYSLEKKCEIAGLIVGEIVTGAAIGVTAVALFRYIRRFIIIATSKKPLAVALHNNWYRRKLEDARYNGTPLGENLKPIPRSVLQRGETPQQAAARLTREGYPGVKVEGGKLVQDIHRPGSELVPALNQELNGKMAVAYIKELDGVPLTTKGQIEAAAAKVHDIWLAKNPWAKNGPLGVSFEALPIAEKLKDYDALLAYTSEVRASLLTVTQLDEIQGAIAFTIIQTNRPSE